MIRIEEPRVRACCAVLLLAAWASGCGPSEPPGPAALEPDYLAELETWKEQRDAGLRDPDGWLTLAGLYWLEEGENRFGSDPEGEVVFPEQVPPRLGVFVRNGDEVHLRVEPGLEEPLLSGGEPVGDMALVVDQDGSPTVLELGSLAFFAIRRPGGLVGIRLRDRNSPKLAEFTGMESFPPSAEWRIEGRYEPYEPAKPIRIPTIMGTVNDATSPGALVFEVGRKTVRLDPTGDPSQGFFLAFGDATNGEETYGAGRFLAVEPPAEDGTVTLDFNRAYNPPCVFTPYATCPLPPRQNQVELRIEAGEKVYGTPDH